MSRDSVLAWVMVAPCLVLRGVFVVAPALLDFPLSLMRYDITWPGS